MEKESQGKQKKAPYELWFRRPYQELIEKEELRVALRPGDRRYPNPKGAREKEEALVRIVREPGDEKLNILPQFTKFTAKIKIDRILVKRIAELTGEDLKYCSSELGEIVLPPTEETISRNLESARRIMQTMPPHAIISDIMLRNEDTATIREAKREGFNVLDGRPMVLNQAFEAFWLVNQEMLKDKNITKEQVAEVMKRAASTDSGQAASS